MPNKEILQNSLKPVNGPCSIWNRFLSLSNQYELSWSKGYIFDNSNFKAVNPIYISNLVSYPDELYNAFRNLNTWYISMMWIFKVKALCELESTGNLNESFLKKVVEAVYNDDQDEIDRLGALYSNPTPTQRFGLPTYEDIVNDIRKYDERYTEYIGRYFIIEVELHNRSHSRWTNASMSKGNHIENDDSEGILPINSPVYILFSFVSDDYFRSEFINGQGLSCNIFQM